MYIYMYIYTYIGIFICIHIHTYICIYAYTYAYVHIHICTHTHRYIHIYMPTHLYVHTSIFVYVYTHTSMIATQSPSLQNRLFRETSNTLQDTSAIPTFAKRMKQHSTHEQNLSPCATGMSAYERDFVTNERVEFAGDVLQMKSDNSPLATYEIARCLGVWVRLIGRPKRRDCDKMHSFSLV